MTDKIQKTDAEWKAQLSADAYKVTRRKGTERAWSHPYNHVEENGVFRCVCCSQPLFQTTAKFDSGTGWPSFYSPVDGEAVDEREDNSLFRKRTEIVCSKCEAHLGHVFPDGPEPTGMRYCMNGVALDFQPKDG